MDKNKSEVEAFLGDLGSKEEAPFSRIEAPVEEPVEEVTDEKPLPFNRDPKIQKYLDKREKEMESRFRASIGEAKPEANQADDEVTEVLTQLIGNDTPEKVAMVKKFQNILEKGNQKAQQAALAELDSRQQAEVRADAEAEQELENAFDNIEEAYDVDITSNNPLAKKTRQEFISFVEKIAPKDRNGEVIDFPDMNSAWETFNEMKTRTPSRAKTLASRSMARSSEASAKPQPKANWQAADDFIDSLK